MWTGSAILERSAELLRLHLRSERLRLLNQIHLFEAQARALGATPEQLNIFRKTARELLREESMLTQPKPYAPRHLVTITKEGSVF